MVSVNGRECARCPVCDLAYFWDEGHTQTQCDMERFAKWQMEGSDGAD